MKDDTISSIVQEKIQKIRTEIDEFRLQLALGKSETIDKFEEVKKTFKAYIDSLDLKVKEVKNDKDEVLLSLRQKMDELRLQLALGKAEGKEAIEKQKKNIISNLHQLENLIVQDDLGEEIELTFREEIEKFKIKLEILKVKATLGKYELRDSWEKNKTELDQNLAEWKKKTEKLMKGGKEKFDVFGEEISEAFLHLKKAVGLGN